MNIKINKALLLILSLVLLLGIPLTTNASETTEDPQIIKVGIFNAPGFWNISNELPVGGYAFDYLNALNNYGNWTYSYEYHSLEECIDLLKAGKLDIVPGLQATDSRKNDITFPLQSMGIESGIILTRPDNNQLIKNDYTTVNHLKIGCLTGNIYGQEHIQTFESLYNLTNEIVFYDTTSEMFQALDNKDVDAILTVSITSIGDYKTIASLHDAPIYIAVRNNATELVNELDYAQSNLRIDDPYFQTDLTRKYNKLSVQSLDFSTNEITFLTDYENQSFNVGVYADSPPYCSMNSDGSYSGIIPSVFEQITKYTGLTFHYIAVSNMNDGINKLRNNLIDILPQYWKTLSLPTTINASKTTEYLPTSLVTIYTSDSDYDRTNTLTLGVSRDISQLKDTFSHNDNIQYSIYQSFNDCIEALDRGDINGVLTSYDFAQGFLATNKTINYQFSVYDIAQSFDTNQCMVIANSDNVYLFSIINKCIRHMNEAELPEIISTATMVVSGPFNLSAWMKDNLLFVFIFFFILLSTLLVLFIATNKHRIQLRRIVNTDTVTNCISYSHFLKVASKAIASTNSEYVILKMNIIHFRFINEIYGQFVGDDVLSIIVDCSHNYLDNNEYITRQEADHLILLLKSQPNYQERFKQLIQEANKVVHEKYNLKLRFNAGSYTIVPGDSIINSIEKTSHILADFNSSDVNIIRPFDKSREKIINAIKLIETDSDNALRNHQFVAYYQPKYNYIDDQITGAEALVRWIHPTNGSIPLNEFLPYFEQSGAIIGLDYYVFEEACKFIRSYNMRTGRWITISSNFSTKHLNYSDFVGKLYAIAKRYSLPTRYLEIEITETVAMVDPEVLLNQSKLLHRAGFKLTLDDFGSGYSSLGILETCDFDIIKLDRTFMLSTMASKDVNILKGIIQLITSSGMEIICEGVETQEQISILRTTSCDTIQGFFFSKPIPEDDFNILLERNQK